MIVDTNVFVAANWSEKSSSYRIVRALKLGQLRLIYSPAIYREASFILERAKTRKDFQLEVDKIFKKGVKSLPTEKIDIIRDDPEDNKYLSCASETDTKFIITNDHHLLELRKFKATRILTPRDFCEGYL